MQLKLGKAFVPLFLHGTPAQKSQKDRLDPTGNAIKSPFLMNLQSDPKDGVSCKGKGGRTEFRKQEGLFLSFPFLRALSMSG